MDPEPKVLRLTTYLTTVIVLLGCVAAFFWWWAHYEAGQATRLPTSAPGPADAPGPASPDPRSVEPRSPGK